MLDHETIAQQQELLAAHRRTLAALLFQQALLGGPAHANPGNINGIARARSEIHRIKMLLRENGVQVADTPNDEAPQTGNVASLQPTGEQTTISSGGGDVAGRDLDKRQGKVFVEGSSTGDIIGGDKASGDQITVGPIVGSIAVAIGAGAQANATIIQMPKPESVLHQFRAPVSDFVGREHEIDELVQSLSKAASSGAAAAISGVRGMGGIGKTELAYVVADRLVRLFPDAQLLVELRGASGSPLTPEQALQTVIRSFEREAELPDSLTQLQSVYRSLVTSKKILILADDASDTEQVRPLLPPPGSALLVTSRNRFILPGMQTVDLEVLSPTDAEKLLLEVCPRIGKHARELARLCGYLPLALRVSASFLEANDDYDVQDYLKQLPDERMQSLSNPDNPLSPQASVEASLSLSYETLGLLAQRTLRQLSVFPASFDREAAVAVVEVEGDIPEVLRLLRRRNLLEWDTTLERYSLHDLVRAFAVARLVDTDAVRLRHARHYAEVASHIGKNLHLNGQILAELALFDQERAHIDAGWCWAREHVGEENASELILTYAYAAANIGELRYDTREDLIVQFEVQLAAAQRLKQRVAESAALSSLGNAYADIGETRKAINFYEQALVITREIGDRRGEGGVLSNLGAVYKDLGEARKAINFYEQALVITREIGDRRGESDTLLNLGGAYADLGDARKAITSYEQALVIRRELGDRRGEGDALGNLGVAYYLLGERQKAINFYEQALVITREIGDRRGEATALDGLGAVYKDLGEARKAINFYEQALVITREIGDRHGEGVALGGLGAVYKDLGEARKAVSFFEQALVIVREIGDRHGEGVALGSLGAVYTDLGETQKALDFYEQTLVVAREVGDRLGEAIASWNLGVELTNQSDLERAIALMQVYVDFLNEIGHPDAEEYATKVDQLRQYLTASQNSSPAGTPDKG